MTTQSHSSNVFFSQPNTRELTQKAQEKQLVLNITMHHILIKVVHCRFITGLHHLTSQNKLDTMILKSLTSRRLANNAILRAAVGNSSTTSNTAGTSIGAVAARPVSTASFIQQRRDNRYNTTGVIATPQSHYRRWLSDATKPHTGTEEGKEEDAKTTEEKATADGDAPAEEEGPSEAEKLKEELAEMKNQLLRSLAEQENIRSIARRDVEAAKNFSVKSFAKSMLEVADNLDRALDSVHEDEAAKNDTLKTFVEGIEMTGSGLVKALKSNGVEAYCEHPGDEFDADKHQALMEYQDPKATPGTVGVVMKKGFKLNGRVLRAAEVGVVKK
jgi:molecular chaperone GrpE